MSDESAQIPPMDAQEGPSDTGLVDPECSMLRFFYPVRFEPKHFKELVEAARGAVWPQKPKASVWTEVEWGVGKPPYGLKDCVPEIPLLIGAEGDDAHARLRFFRLSNVGKTEPYGLGTRHLRWRFSKKNRDPIPFEIKHVELVLSQDGVALLMLELTTASTAFSDWQDLTTEMRHLERVKSQSIALSTKDGSPAESPYIFQGQVPTSRGVVEGLLKTLHVKRTDASLHWWTADLFSKGKLFPWLYLKMSGVTPALHQKNLWAIQNLYGSGHSALTKPSLDDVRAPLKLGAGEDCHVSYSQVVMIHADDSVVLNTKQRISRIRSDYGLMVLMALHQRFSVVALSTLIPMAWRQRDEAHGEDLFEELEEQLIGASMGFVSAIHTKGRYRNFFTQLRSTWAIEASYQDVASRLREVAQYLSLKQSRRVLKQSENLEKVLRTLAIFVGAPSLLLAFLGVNLKGFTSGEEGLAWEHVLIGSAAFAGVAFVSIWAIRLVVNFFSKER